MNQSTKRFLLFLGVGSLALSLACGGGGSGKGSSGGGSGGFTNASLSGHYAYQVKGYSLPSQSPFSEAGVFTADGSGHITSGTDDFAAGTSAGSDNMTGTYQVNSDGSATLAFNFASGGSATFALTLSSSSQFYMVEVDSIFNTGLVGSGTGQKQDTTAFSSVPSGTFVFHMHTVNNAQLTSKVGIFTATGGSVTGNADSNRSFVFGPSTITGTLNFPDATSGRGSGTFTDSSSGTSTFLYYAVDAGHLILFSSDTGTLGTGAAEKQTGGPFSAASFSGPYAFGSSGDTSTFFEQTNTVGRFNADGSGAITAGTLDAVTDGTSSTDVLFNGTYAVTSNGRVAVTLTPSTGSIQQVYWMVSPSRAFSVTNSSNTVEDGSLDLQVGSFSNSTLSGIYAFGMDGFDTGLANTKERTGLINWGGSGTLSLSEVSNALGAASASGTLTGTYMVTTNGRATASVTGLSSNLVFYLVSGSNAYVLQNDTGVAIKGKMTKQP